MTPRAPCLEARPCACIDMLTAVLETTGRDSPA
jgi:hypothetical protein